MCGNIMQRFVGGNLLLTFVTLMGTLSSAAEMEPALQLREKFQDPPASARPWAYWWWLDGNASKAGITRDLREMKRQGIAGVLIFDAGLGKGSPVGPRFMSSAWRELFSFAVSEAARLGLKVSLNLCSGWDCGGTWVQPKDACKKLVFTQLQVTGPEVLSQPLPTPPTVDGFYRDIAILAFKSTGSPAGSTPKQKTVGKPNAATVSRNKSRIKYWDVKSGNRGLRSLPLGAQYEIGASTSDEVEFTSGTVFDLSRNIDKQGRLRWNVPKGDWSIFRFGYTLLGAKTKCTSPGSQGYEIDFLDSSALDMHFAETAAKLLKDVGPNANQTIKYFHDDSWEVGNPNWSAGFRKEFQKRRGYELLPYLPVLTGKIVNSREVSNRFLWDIRRTIADCIAENHYGRLAQLARQHAIGTHPEAGGPFFPHIDALMNLGRSDIPMGEFWARKTEPDGLIVWSDHYYLCDTIKQAASAAHIYGKHLSQAEAFTTMGPNWEKDPFMLKDIGDRAFCQGLTRNVLCFYVHQPDLNIKPGYQWEAAGTHFDRNITWWNQIDAWIDYLSRCQFLLQQGLFVADICYFYGEDAPNYVPARQLMNPAMPAGYDCDVTNAEVLLERMRVENGRIVLPDGMSYRMLVLPVRRTMSEKVLSKIAKLVEGGATVVGPKPIRAPGLQGYPKCDETVAQLAARVWGPCDGRSIKQHRFGDGRVIWGRSLAEILLQDGMGPDFSYTSMQADTKLDYIHRASPETDIYFISNQKNRFEQVECTFRVQGKTPELWMPDTGRIQPQIVYDSRNGTRLPLRLAPRGSVFVVFREPATGQHIISWSKDGKQMFPGAPGIARQLPDAKVTRDKAGKMQLRSWTPGTFTLHGSTGRSASVTINAVPAPIMITGAWKVHFPKGWGVPETVVFERLTCWTKQTDPGVKYFSGTATYEKEFDLPPSLLAKGTRLSLDLGHLKNVAEVRINGNQLGVLWKPPFRVDVTRFARPGKNQLEVRITNLWPNRLIGDQFLPKEKRFTRTNVKKFTKDSPLLESGLLGPVRIHISFEKPVVF